MSEVNDPKFNINSNLKEMLVIEAVIKNVVDVSKVDLTAIKYTVDQNPGVENLRKQKPAAFKGELKPP